MDHLIGTPLERIAFRVLVADYNVKISLRAKLIHFVYFPTSACWTSEKDFVISAFRLSVVLYDISLCIHQDMAPQTLSTPLTHSGVCKGPNAQDETRQSGYVIHRHSPFLFLWYFPITALHYSSSEVRSTCSMQL